MSEISQLERLSLLTKICSILDNELGINDIDLAEYIVHLGENSPNYQSFHKQLNENGASLSNGSIEKIYTYIENIQKNKKSSTTVKQQSSTDQLIADGNVKTKQPTDDESKRVSSAYRDDDNFKAPTAPIAPPSNIHPSRLQQIRSHSDERSDYHAGKRYRNNESESNDYKVKSEYKHNDEKYDDTEKKYKYNDFTVSTDDNTLSLRDGLRVGAIYSGVVSKIMDFGAFIRITDGKPYKYKDENKIEGLLHISQIKDKVRVTNVSDELQRNQAVKVKCIAITGSDERKKYSFSMKDVDQVTGEDLQPDRKFNIQTPDLHNIKTESVDGQTMYKASTTDYMQNRNRRTFLSEQEQWEINQLRKAGAKISTPNGTNKDEKTAITTLTQPTAVTLNKYNDGTTSTLDDDADEGLEIELNEDEPVFLRGQFSNAMNLSASNEGIKVVRMPDGSMSRAALTQSALAKERREAREAEKESQVMLPSDISRTWEDPLSHSNERYLASELRDIHTGIAESRSSVPEWKKQTLMKNVTYGRITNLTIQQQREELPIYKLKNEFIQAVSEHNLLIVIGETGSGKTTQMTQYLMEAGFIKPGTQLGCTQPRRVAAMSVAKRVSEEVGCKLGSIVGYSIRFEDCTSSETIIKYMTDGMLLREILSDKLLSRYSVIILDEAHERTINTDILFGLLKTLMIHRKDLKLIVTSATLDAEKFSEYFNNAPIFTIPGRMYPVTILYAKQPELDYLDASLMTVMQIHLSQPPGDILLFLTGKEEIDTACEILYERIESLGSTKCPPLIVLPVYSALPNEIQSKIFEPTPPGERKCVIATNIAEASVTIPGITYVIDPGFVKQKIFNQKLNLDSLQVVPISQASAMQRAGRAGRVGPGKCYRLYTEQSYTYELLKATIPEIQRVNLNMTILQLKAIGINDILNFPFMDAPDSRSIISALSNLYTLGCLDEEGLLTTIGRRMAEFPLDPNLSKILIMSTNKDTLCSEEMLTIVAMLSIETVFYRPKDKQTVADSKRSKFHAPEGDHLTLLNVYDSWKRHDYSASFAHDNFLHLRQLKRAQEIRKQIEDLLIRYKLPIASSRGNIEIIQKCICSGYFMNAAKKDPVEGYKTLVDSQPVYIHPSSSLFHRQPDWIIYHTLILTSKEYLHGVMHINPKWLIEVAPQFYKSASNQALSKRKRRERIEPLFDRYHPPNQWRLSKRQG